MMTRWDKAAQLVGWTASILAGALIIYQLTMVWHRVTGVSEHYAIFLGAVFLISILIKLQDMLKEGPDDAPVFFWIKVFLLSYAMIAGAYGGFYIQENNIRLETSIGMLNDTDRFIGIATLIALLIAGYFIWSWVICLFVIGSLAYFMYGNYLPGVLGHFGYGLDWVLSYTTLHPVLGIYWLIPLTVDVIFYVILVSAVLSQTGTVRALLEVGKAVGARITGGAAYPALIGSATIGTMVGQAVANAIITGRVTIPMMKGQGIRPAMAAGIEASASAGALIMPPIMGLGAFVMAFYLNIPYIQVALHAVWPALLYYAGVTLGIYFNARVSGYPRLQQPIDWYLVLRICPTFIIGIGILGTLLLMWYTPKMAGFWALIGVLGSALLLQGPYRPRLRVIGEALLDGAKTACTLGLLLALIGPVSQTVMTTGLGVNLANELIIGPVGQYLILALPLVMLLTLFTGLAVIEAAAYIVMALALAPFLIELGFEPVATHMFIYFYAVFATLMPPIAITAQATSQIAECDFWETCFIALRLAFVALAVPFVFILNPVILQFPHASVALLLALVGTLAGITMLAAAFWGWLINPLRFYDRLALAAAGVILLSAAAMDRADLMAVGLVLGGLLWAWQLFKKRREVRDESLPGATEAARDAGE